MLHLHTFTVTQLQCVTGLWPANSLDLKPCLTYLWGPLEDNVFVCEEFSFSIIIVREFMSLQNNNFNVCLKTVSFII